jgi:hypothetical protein
MWDNERIMITVWIICFSTQHEAAQLLVKMSFGALVKQSTVANYLQLLFLKLMQHCHRQCKFTIICYKKKGI